MAEIVIMGELLVEIMRAEEDVQLFETGKYFRGPLALASCSRIILYKKWQSRVYNAKWEMDIPGGDRRVC